MASLYSVTVAELRGRLRAKGLATSGNRDQLCQRLAAALDDAAQTDARSPTRSDPCRRTSTPVSPLQCPSAVMTARGNTTNNAEEGITLIFWCCGFALMIRLILVMFGEWQDRTQRVPYTDVDYRVFTDAAAHMARGNSPYARATYRYTPLLAWMLQPNVWGLPVYGKLLFVVADVMVGWLVERCLALSSVTPRVAAGYSCLWLFNPITMIVSTRGNAEALIALSVLITLYCFRRRLIVLTGLFLALAIHLKMFPIIYSWPLFCGLGQQSSSGYGNIWANLRKPNSQQITLAVSTIVTLTLVTLTMHSWCVSILIVILAII